MTIKHKKCISKNVNEELKWDCHCSGCHSCVQGKLIRNLKYYPKKSKTKQKQNKNKKTIPLDFRPVINTKKILLLVHCWYSFHLIQLKAFIFPYLLLTEVIVERCSVKKSVLRNLAKFTRKHLCKSLFF